jgi:uncharacterized protein (DUF1810 family)
MNTISNDDLYNLNRFLTAQENVYEKALTELKNGKKRSHWMWYVFPQIEGLGKSSPSRFYGIKTIEEAKEYLNHPILGERLLECTKTILSIKGRSASQIFGFPDDLKLKSSMTLFSLISDSESLFQQALDKFFQGNKDHKTEYLLTKMKK